MLYAIHAVCNRQDGPYDRTIQMPTFYLDSNVQGLTSEEDARICAERMFRATNPDASFTVTAFKRSDYVACPDCGDSGRNCETHF